MSHLGMLNEKEIKNDGKKQEYLVTVNILRLSSNIILNSVHLSFALRLRGEKQVFNVGICMLTSDF